MAENNLTFEALRDNADALTALQMELYDTVYLNMQLAPASGAFYILDTTVNSHSETPLYNGIYLKYVNLYSASTVNNEITLYRGSFPTAKEGNLNFHSGWANELSTDFFEHCDLAFPDGTHYILSPSPARGHTHRGKTVDTGKCGTPSEPFPQKSHVSYMPEWHRQSMSG